MAEIFDKYSCTYCQDDISGIRVHCVICENFELCLQCFSAGAEIGPHKNDHSYQFMDSGELSVFRGRGAWSAREELHLLDAIEQYGFGNWEDISRHIESRSPEEAKDEYITRFLNGSIGRSTWGAAGASKADLIDNTPEDTGPLSPTSTQRMMPLDINPEEASQLGYMPYRDDFEREFDHEAEQLVSLLSLNADDDNLDVAMKLSIVDWYIRRLRERARRKRVVRDYQLVKKFFRGTLNKSKPNKDHTDLEEEMRPFCQFYTAQEYEDLISSLEREQELRYRLAELHKYRFNGVTTIAECFHFEQHVAALSPSKKSSTVYRNDIPGSSGSPLDLEQTSQPKSGESDTNSPEQKFTLKEEYPPPCSPAPVNPGTDLLTSNELQLCSALKLQPIQYISLKTYLLTEDTCKLDLSEEPLASVVTFLNLSGWLQVSNNDEVTA